MDSHPPSTLTKPTTTTHKPWTHKRDPVTVTRRPARICSTIIARNSDEYVNGIPNLLQIRTPPLSQTETNNRGTHHLDSNQGPTSVP